MEAAQLNAPPDWLERIVLLAIPPAAREEVAGDLWETYCSPRQYAAEALRTVPFVIASQARRNLNLPAVMLQGALIFIFLGGPATLIFLPALLLRSAYQETARPSPRHVFRQTMFVSSGVMALLLLFMSVKLPYPIRAGIDHTTWFSLFLNALFLSPFLCLFRTVLILLGDRATLLAVQELPRHELQQNYCAFLEVSLYRNILHAVALAFAAVCGFFLAWNTLVVGLFLLASLYLLQDCARKPVSQLDFVSLRTRYQQELAHQQQLRRFLRWLWFTPMLMALHAGLAMNGLKAGKPIAGFLDFVAVAILCFLVTALNREHGGRMQEQIGLLDRAREKVAP